MHRRITLPKVIFDLYSVAAEEEVGGAGLDQDNMAHRRGKAAVKRKKPPPKTPAPKVSSQVLAPSQSTAAI